MRAHRLLAELLLLQARGGVTAAELAAEMEVSERTVYRDMEALQMAGVPIVSLAGPGGGYSLYEDWRSDLTGLSDQEAAALTVALATGTGAPLDPALRAALVKLAAALPPAGREEVERLQRRIHVDSSPPTAVDPAGTILAVLADALRTGSDVEVALRGPFGTRISGSGPLLGLVSSGGAWHMVWAPFGREPRAERVGDVLEVRMVSAAAPPDDFDLAAFWEEAGRRRAPVAAFRATLRVSARLLPLLERRFGVAADHGRVTLPFPSIEEARTAVLGWGGAVEVLAPQALRRTVADFAARAAAVYVPNAVPAGRSSVGNDAAGSL